jgi:uncharacterized phage protein gp47/JayE
MPPLTLKTLLTPATFEEMKQELANRFATAGFPVSSWQPFSTGRTLTEGESSALADLGQLLGQIAAGGFLDYASGGWLDLLGKNLYGLTRKPGLPTLGQLELSDDGGVGPVDVKPGKLLAQSGGLFYRNVDGGTLALNGTLALTWQAVAIGAEYNASNGATFELSTTIPGVSLAPKPLTLGGSWISQQGINPETDPAYRTRCRTRWPTLGGGASIEAYTSWALTASDEVSSVAVFAHTPLPGQVSIFLAGAGGPVSPGAVAAVQAYLTPARIPVCVEALVDTAATFSLVIAGTVLVKASRYVTASSRIQKRLQKLVGDMPIGGSLTSGQIIQAIMDADPGVVDVSLESGDTDYALSPSQVAVLGLTLSDTPGPGLLCLTKVP